MSTEHDVRETSGSTRKENGFGSALTVSRLSPEQRKRVFKSLSDKALRVKNKTEVARMAGYASTGGFDFAYDGEVTITPKRLSTLLDGLRGVTPEDPVDMAIAVLGVPLDMDKPKRVEEKREPSWFDELDELRKLTETALSLNKKLIETAPGFGAGLKSDLRETLERFEYVHQMWRKDES